MRIISWNVRFDNKNALNLISEAMSLSPDVLCLQEVRGELIPQMRTMYPHYFVYGCLEESHLDPAKQNFLCTVTKSRAIDVSVINYEQKKSSSLWEKFYFKKINSMAERHAALVISIPVLKGLFQIVNIHLSSAINPAQRVSNFKYIIENSMNHPKPTVFCGDFNIIDNMYFRILSGWIRGFRKTDYKLNERKIFDLLFADVGLINIFNNMSTYIMPWRGLQLDHILVPDYIQVSNKVIGKKRFASDHRMILVDIPPKYFGI